MQLTAVVEKMIIEIIRNIYTLRYFLNSWTRFLVLSFQMGILVEQRGQNFQENNSKYNIKTFRTVHQFHFCAAELLNGELCHTPSL